MQPCIGNSNMNGGAMTNILIDVVKNNHSITYGELLDSIHTSIDKANQGCLLARIFKRVFNNMLLQVSFSYELILGSQARHFKCT